MIFWALDKLKRAITSFIFKSVSLCTFICSCTFIWTDSSCTSILTFCSFITLHISILALKERRKYLLTIQFFFRIVQTVMQLKDIIITDYTTRNYFFCNFYICGLYKPQVYCFLNVLLFVNPQCI